MEWTRSETIGLASASCVFCRGLGLRKTPTKGETKPCGCVFREIFRACYSRFRHCKEKSGFTSKLTLEKTTGASGFRFYGRRNEEYIADFELTCRRSLSQQEHDLFRYHYLLGADWKLCAQRMEIDKGVFFYTKYRIEEKLGRVFRELQPYALFPLDQYFGGVALRKVSAFRVGRTPEQATPVEDKTIVASTNVLEMPRRSDTISHRFPVHKREEQAA